MEDKIITPKLTILIPTRNRAKYLKICLNRIIRSIKFGNIKDGDVEILVVDNFSKDETKLIVDKFISKHNFVRYFHHLKPYSCAEESILHSLSKAEGEYVWTFGDDDYMNFSAIGIMMNIIRDNKYKLIVVNTDWIVNRKRRSFISFSKKDNIEYIEYSCGSKLFSDLGFMHITTGLPLLCFKKNEFDNLYFKKAVDISSIYSFSFSLMASFYKSMCLFIAKPLVIMTENKINDEYSRLSHLAISNKHLPRYYWSSGIIGQISLLSSKTNIDLGYFLMYREVIVDRVFYKNFELYVLEYVISFLIEDLKNNKF